MSRFILLLLIATLLSGGCRPAASRSQRDPGLVLFRFAGGDWTVPWRSSAKGSATARTRLVQGKCLVAQQHYREAEECLSQLSGTPLESEAALLIGVSRVHRGEARRGEASIREAIRAEPKNTRYRVALVWALCQQGRFSDAESVALETAKATTDESLWGVLHEVRRLKSNRAKERTAYCIFWGFVALMCAVLFVISRGMNRAKARQIRAC